MKKTFFALLVFAVVGFASCKKSDDHHTTAESNPLLKIIHHQSAVDMAKAAKMYAQTPFVKDMADMIIAAQTVEIAQIKAWLAAGND